MVQVVHNGLLCVCVCVCVWVGAHARACVRARACVCVWTVTFEWNDLWRRYLAQFTFLGQGHRYNIPVQNASLEIVETDTDSTTAAFCTARQQLVSILLNLL